MKMHTQKDLKGRHHNDDGSWTYYVYIYGHEGCTKIEFTEDEYAQLKSILKEELETGKY